MQRVSSWNTPLFYLSPACPREEYDSIHPPNMITTYLPPEKKWGWPIFFMPKFTDRSPQSGSCWTIHSRNAWIWYYRRGKVSTRTNVQSTSVGRDFESPWFRSELLMFTVNSIDIYAFINSRQLLGKSCLRKHGHTILPQRTTRSPIEKIMQHIIGKQFCHKYYLLALSYCL
jgi:hypothetical protein